METGEISKKLKRGKHTTRHSQVIPVGHDTYLMDTPGFSSFISDRYRRTGTLRRIFRSSADMKNSADFRDADISMNRTVA